MNTSSRLTAELRDKAYRDAYVRSQITFGLPFQIRALRTRREWTQDEFARRAGMTQPRVAEIERPGGRRFNLETLLRIASAFDIALEVRFASFGDVVGFSERFEPDTFNVPSFDEEMSATAPAEGHGPSAAMMIPLIYAKEAETQESLRVVEANQYRHPVFNQAGFQPKYVWAGNPGAQPELLFMRADLQLVQQKPSRVYPYDAVGGDGGQPQLAEMGAAANGR